MKKGYIYLHRKILENPIIMKDSEHLSVWIYLLLEATHRNVDALFKGNRITLLPGQLLSGSKSIGMKLNINYIKVHRILKDFENEKQIEQQTSNKNRLITILKWQEYQEFEKQNEKQVKNDYKTDEKQVKTNNNDNNVNNEIKKEEIYKEEKSFYFQDEKLNNKFIEFLEMRKTKNISNDEKSLKKVLTKLEPYTDEVKIEMLENSIKNKWELVYKPKVKKTSIRETLDEKFNGRPVGQDKEGLEELEKILEEFK